MTSACGHVADRHGGCPEWFPALVQMLWVHLVTFAAGWTRAVCTLQTDLEVVQDSLQLQVAASGSHVPMGLQASQAGIHRPRLLPTSCFRLPLAGLAAGHDLQSLQSGPVTQVGEKIFYLEELLAFPFKMQRELQMIDVGYRGRLQPTDALDT